MLVQAKLAEPLLGKACLVVPEIMTIKVASLRCQMIY
jgi:hypothetical protein